MKFAAFDLETAKILPAGTTDLKRHAPLGIACAAIARSDAEEIELWTGVPQMTADECADIVVRLQVLADDGYTIVTWNGASFDFFVLGQESGMVDACGDLAFTHVDLMVIVTFTKGYYLGLDKALAGAGLAGKHRSVTLRDGRALTDMSGADAPALWAAGEQDAVVEYLKADVSQLLLLAENIERTRQIAWLSGRGRPQSVRVNRLISVIDAFEIPTPDTSWMSNAPKRSDFVDWIPGWQGRVG